MSQNILSVAEFVRDLKSLVSTHQAFKNVAVVGEISNFNAHHSGHFYFSLKDKDARISCIMFRSKSSSVLFKPKNGDKVVIMGYVDVFESAGTIQIYVERMNLDGLGDLHIRYEALKKEYEQKGYFDLSHKKAMPSYPRRIGVITGADSAAYADISRTLRERWPYAKQIDLLAYVQGENAVNSLVERISEANTLDLDAIILARGGGSIEDLWAFNEEKVVEAVYNSETFIVSGVGHESDTTLVDFVADYRAATPTAAAVSITPDIQDVSMSLRDYKNRYYVAVRNKIRTLNHSYDEIMGRGFLGNPQLFFDKKSQTLDYYQSSITHALRKFDMTRDYLNSFDIQVSNLMSNKILAYENKLRDNNWKNEQAIQAKFKMVQWQVSANQDFLIRKERDLDRDFTKYNEQVSLYSSAIKRSIARQLNLNHSAFSDIIKTLDLLSPLKIMGRGYALIYQDDTLLKSAANVNVGDELKVLMKDGTLMTRIEKRELKDE